MLFKKMRNLDHKSEDKIKYDNLFSHLISKGFKENIAEIMANMIIFKEKYGVKYSPEQEAMLQESFRYKH